MVIPPKYYGRDQWKLLAHRTAPYTVWRPSQLLRDEAGTGTLDRGEVGNPRAPQRPPAHIERDNRHLRLQRACGHSIEPGFALKTGDRGGVLNTRTPPRHDRDVSLQQGRHQSGARFPHEQPQEIARDVGIAPTAKAERSSVPLSRRRAVWTAPVHRPPAHPRRASDGPPECAPHRGLCP